MYCRVPSLRTDFFVYMSGQISTRRRQLSTNNGHDIIAVMFRPKSKLWVTLLIIGPCRVNSGELSVKHAADSLHSALFANSQAFWRLILSIFCFLNVSFLFQNSTLLCRQNRIIVDMAYFLKIDVLSPILSTKCLSTTALVLYVKYSPVIMRAFIILWPYLLQWKLFINKVLGTKKFYLLYQISCYISCQQTIKIKVTYFIGTRENSLLYQIFCYIRSLYRVSTVYMGKEMCHFSDWFAGDSRPSLNTFWKAPKTPRWLKAWIVGLILSSTENTFALFEAGLWSI